MLCSSEKKSTIKLFESEQRTDHSEKVHIGESIEAAEVEVRFVQHLVHFVRDQEFL
jgi:hypothetical protein